MYNDYDRNWTPYEHDVDDEYKNLHVVLTRLNPVDLAILEAQGFLSLRSSIMKGRTNRRGSKKKNEYDTTRSRKKANATKRESKQRQSRPRRKQDDSSVPKRRMRSSSVNTARTDKEIKTFNQRPLSVDRRMTRSQNRPSLPDKLDEYIHGLNESFDESITDVRISEDRHKSAAEKLDSLMTEMENEFYSNGNETTRVADKNESEPRTSDGGVENVTDEVDMIQSNTIDSSQDNMIDVIINTEVHSDTVPEKSSDSVESHEVTKSKDSEERPEDDASNRNVEVHDDRTSPCDALESESKGESIHVESSEKTDSPSVDSLKEKEIVLSPNSVKNEWTQVEDRVKDEKFEEYTTTGVVLEQFRESSVERNIETSRETSGNSIPDVDDRASKTFGLCEDAFNFQTDHSNVMKLVYKKLSESTKKADRIAERAVVQNGDKPKRDGTENEKKSKRAGKKKKEIDIGPAVVKIAEPNYKRIDFVFSKSGKDGLGVQRSSTIESYLREEDGSRKTAGKRRASTSGERTKKRKSGSSVDEPIVRFDDRLIKRDSCSSRILPSYGIDGWENDPYTDSDSSTRAVVSDTLDELSSSNTDYSIANPLRKKRKKVLPRMFSVYADYERTNGATIEKPKKTVPRTYARKQKSILNVYHLPDGRTSSHDDDDTAPNKIRKKKKVVRFLTDDDPARGDATAKQKRKRLGTRIQHNGKQTARHVTGDSLLEDTAARYRRPVSPDMLSDDDRNPTAYAVLIEDAVTTVSPSGIVDSNEMFEDDR